MASSDTQLPHAATADDDVAQSDSAMQPPILISPPRSKTPPAITGKRAHSSRIAGETEQPVRSGSEPVNATALNKALQQVESGRTRDSKPSGRSPSRKRQKVQGGGGGGGMGGGGGSDRFIPNRSGQDLQASYSLLHEDGSPATPSRHHQNKVHSTEVNFHTRDANRTYSNILRSEMFDSEVPQAVPQSREGPDSSTRSRTPPSNMNNNGASILQGASLTPSTPHKNLFSYGSAPTPSLTPRSTSRSERGPNINARSEIYSLSPVKYSSQSMLLSPRKTPRAVSKVPYKVLDAPELQDDFYLNLVDWGNSDVLAVGLADTVYLWSREDGCVKSLCKLDGDTVTSVSWIQRGSHLAIGTAKGLLLIYDTVAERRLRTMTGHSARLSSLAWNAHILSTGSRDRTILHRDVRMPAQFLRRLTGHKQEVCGLKWNPDTEQLASGGNDNKIFVWDRMEERWLHRWGEQEGGHKAAVKAIAWSPHQRGLLASGGGTADRCIKFWNTIASSQASSTTATAMGQSGGGVLPPNDLTANSMHFDTSPNIGLAGFSSGVSGFTTNQSTITSSSSSSSPSHQNPNIANNSSNNASNTNNTTNNPHLIRSHDTGSQVCNLLFSTLTSELVSTHGYSQHAINIWKYPSMQQVASLTGHTYRVLYLSMSPDGAVIVTGAGDETLRFWDVFSRKEKERRRGIVGEWGVIR